MFFFKTFCASTHKINFALIWISKHYTKCNNAFYENKYSQYMYIREWEYKPKYCSTHDTRCNKNSRITYSEVLFDTWICKTTIKDKIFNYIIVFIALMFPRHNFALFDKEMECFPFSFYLTLEILCFLFYQTFKTF